MHMTESSGLPVEISVDIPVQAGLKHSINLNLQNRDELHFTVGEFWLEWFPCTKPETVDSYVEAVTGFISGRYRVLEHFRGTHCVRAQLQEPVDGRWKTIGNYRRIRPFPWHMDERVLRNV